MKSKVIQNGPHRAFAVVFDPGEEVVAGLLRFASEQHLAGAYLSAIGAFERVTLGFFEFDKKEYKKIPVGEQVELVSLVGNIAEDDQGHPKLHAHVVVSKSDGAAYGDCHRHARANSRCDARVLPVLRKRGGCIS